MAKSLFASGLVLFGLGAGCAVEHPAESSTAGMTFEDFKSRISIEPNTGAYVVDWDHVIHGDDALLEFYHRFQQGALAIYTAGGQDVMWDATRKRNLTYCISDGFGARKQLVIDAMRAASDNGWEKFADVNFVYVPAQDATCNAQNTSVVFDVSPIAGAPYLMRAFFPYDPRGQSNVLIDSASFDPQQAGAPFANILAHELGHTLGFRHEHTRPEANAGECYEDDQYRGVTTYDAASVMHYPQCNGTSTTLAFTQRDQQGVASVYGAPVTNVSPMAQVIAPADGATVAPEFTVDASVVDTDLTKAELLIDGILYETLTAAPFQFSVTDLAFGSHTLEIRGTDSSGQTGTQTVTITVANIGGGGAGESGDAGLDEITRGCDGAGGGTSSLFGLGLLVATLLRRAGSQIERHGWRRSPRN